MKVDLHTHSSLSDGQLSPLELLEQAVSRGIDMLSITDHDTADAYKHFGSLDDLGLRMIPGIEFSTFWKKTGIHIVGLNIQTDSDIIRSAVGHQHQARLDRARGIADKLEKLGIQGAWEGVLQIAGDSVIGRPHFARFLIDTGVVKNMKQAFDRYLGAGKVGDVKEFWAPFEKIIEWIRAAGGTAVLAHPAKYRITRTKLSGLLDEFREAGGEGMEVISGKQSVDISRDLARLCRQKSLLASCGSDFHQPGQSWSELGEVAPIPARCQPVWDKWS